MPNLGRAVLVLQLLARTVYPVPSQTSEPGSRRRMGGSRRSLRQLTKFEFCCTSQELDIQRISFMSASMTLILFPILIKSDNTILFSLISKVMILISSYLQQTSATFNLPPPSQFDWFYALSAFLNLLPYTHHYPSFNILFGNPSLYLTSSIPLAYRGLLCIQWDIRWLRRRDRQWSLLTPCPNGTSDGCI